MRESGRRRQWRKKAELRERVNGNQKRNWRPHVTRLLPGVAADEAEPGAQVNNRLTGFTFDFRPAWRTICVEKLAQLE